MINEQFISSFLTQLGTITDIESLKVLGNQKGALAKVATQTTKEMDKISSKISSTTKVPPPNSHTREITKWAKKMAIGFSVPQVKANIGFAQQLSETQTLISSLLKVVKTISDRVNSTQDISETKKTELLSLLNEQTTDLNTINDNIAVSIDNTLSSLDSLKTAFEDVTGQPLDINTTSLDSLISTSNAAISSLDVGTNNIFAQDTPTNIDLPALSGNNTVGNTLTVTDGTWEANSSFDILYQWQRNGTDISGATDNAYTIKPDDRGAVLRCKVTAETLSEMASIESANSGVVLFPPLNILIPEITGTPTVGSNLTTDKGSWYSIELISMLSYQWKADSINISGANSNVYTLTSAELGKAITVEVAAVNADGTTTSISNPTANVT